jgi:hypothetical protein
MGVIADLGEAYSKDTVDFGDSHGGFTAILLFSRSIMECAERLLDREEGNPNLNPNLG